MNNNKPQELIKQSGKEFGEAGMHIAKGIGKSISGTYHLIDSADKTIGNKIGEKSNRVINFTKNNIIKILIVGATLIQGGIKISEYIEKNKANKSDEQEIIQNNNIKKDIFRSNIEFFDKDLDLKIKEKQTIEAISEDIIIMRDAGLTFYLMQKGDIQEGRNANETRTKTINHIRKKLSNLQEFSYLKGTSYAPTDNDVTNTFNIRPDFKKLAQTSTLKRNPFWVPVPLDTDIRIFENSDFLSHAKAGVTNISNYNKEYGKIIGEVLKDYSEKEIAKLITAIALVETGKTDKKIGTDEYNRWETGSHMCFSFGPHHILMKGPGLTARKKLGFTEGQIYHPQNSSMALLGFLIEKTKELMGKNADSEKIAEKIKNDIIFIKNKHNDYNNESLNNFSILYNGRNYKINNYHKKLARAMNIVNLPDNITKNTGGFEYGGLDTSGMNIIYKYCLGEGIDKDAIIRSLRSNYGVDAKGVFLANGQGEKIDDISQYKTGKAIFIKVPTKNIVE